MSENPQKILVMGTTFYTEVFVDMFECISAIAFVGCVENHDRAKCEVEWAGLPVFWHEAINDLVPTHKLVCALATTHRRAWIEQSEAAGFQFAKLMHPSAVISERTKFAPGVSVDAGTVVAGFSRIESHVRIGRQASIGHHTEIGSFSTIHPGAIISGNCKIGPQTIVGTGAVVIDGIEIGAGSVIAAGTVVTKNVPPNVLIAGNPGVVKRHDYGPK